MLQLPRSVRILLAAERIDMRNSIDGLAAVVKSSFNENVFAGHLFVFIGKRADKVKILSWDSGGFVLSSRRIFRRLAERGAGYNVNGRPSRTAQRAAAPSPSRGPSAALMALRSPFHFR